jgi:hypothetical protein
LVQRGIFTSALMKLPVLPLGQEEKDWVAKGVEECGCGRVDLVK